MPYTFCFNRGLPYCITEDVKRCYKCVKNNRRYNGSGIPIKLLRRIKEKKDYLNRKKRFAKDGLG